MTSTLLPFIQILSLTGILCSGTGVSQGTSQVGYGSEGHYYGPQSTDENNVNIQALAEAINAYESSSDRNAGGMSPYSSGGTSMSSTGVGGKSHGASGLSSPFTANSAGNPGGFGIKSPFSASTGPSTAGTGTQGSSGSSVPRPFSMGGSGSGGGMGSMGGSGSGGGMGSMGESGSGGGVGKSPFTMGSGSGSGSNPFSASSNLGGTDMSSLAGVSGGSSGPGGLSGGTFVGNANMLMGHDFSADLVGSSMGGVHTGTNIDGSGSNGQSQYGIDAAKFDTADYQKMLDQLFNPKTYDKELLASPFHGDTYKLPQGQDGSGQGHGYETSHESSIGSYASTDMSSSAYGANSGTFQSVGNTNTGGKGQTYVVTGNSGSGQVSSGSSGGTVHSPFDISGSNTYTHGAQISGSSSGSHSGMTVQSPFQIKGSEKSDTPFKITAGNPNGSNNGMTLDSPFKITDATNGNTPFKINNNDQGASPFKTTDTTGGNPFDTSKFLAAGNFGTGQTQNYGSLSGGQKFEGGTGLLGQAQFQGTSGTSNKNGLDQYGNIDFSKLTGVSSGSGTGTQFHGTSVTSNKNALDQYGNVDFSKLSGMSGNSVALGTSGTNYGSAAGSGSYSSFSGSKYIDYSSGKSNNNNGGVNTGISESQFKTPFESDNYNDLLGNPFDSSSNFNSNHENFNQPFNKRPSQSGGLQSYQGSSGGSAGVPSYLGGHSTSNGQGPAGDPFNQGGSRMHG